MAEMSKAQIQNLQTKEFIKCMFNPTDYSSTKAVKWTARPVLQKDVPSLQFGGGVGRTLKMTLFFDSVFDPNRNLTNDMKALEKLTVIDTSTENKTTSQGRPPFCIFTWGAVFAFTAVVTALDFDYKQFKPDGTPLRFTAKITFLEILDPASTAGTNPTSYGKPGYKRRQVLPGETLALIAYQEYRDAARWRVIADANGIDDPLDISPGQSLAIPML